MSSQEWSLDDEELMLLEQLCYLDDSVCKLAEIPNISYINKKKTVSKLLKDFTPQSLANLRAQGDQVISGGVMEASEWADIIETIKNNDKLMNLTLVDVKTNSEGKTLALCFTDEKNPDAAIVAFKGTTGYGDWYDNFQGLYETDTKCQKTMLDYINNLPYDSITVVGHSKGGNYAQYVGVLSDKVTSAVAMDGQGFSDKFIKEHLRDILRNSGKVKNYSAGSDFVNQLLYALPGVRQIYVEGNGITSVGQNHSPNSLLSVNTETGEISVTVLEDGASEGMSIIRDLTTFIEVAATEEDKQKIANLLGDFTGNILAEGENETAIKNLLSDEEALTTLAAYILKYMDTYDVKAEDINALLESLGVDSKKGRMGELLQVLLDFVKKELSDGAPDAIISDTRTRLVLR
jgi:hypothetical protein